MIGRTLTLLALAIIISGCSSQYGRVSYHGSPKVINVSAYDPKERQRSGSSYSPLNQAALKRNGAKALIARCAKGYEIDTKCADFLVGAERQGFMLGTYFYVLPWTDPAKQADRYIARLKHIKKSRGLKTDRVLLVGDIDSGCNGAQIAAFIRRIEKLTGVTPVIYLENSKGLRQRLPHTSAKHKRIIRRAPYWIALYSNKDFADPQALTDAYGIWDTWAMWQFAGVLWENRRSSPKVFKSSGWRAPTYFGNMDRPMERNAFNGSEADLRAFWKRHSWKW